MSKRDLVAKVLSIDVTEEDVVRSLNAFSEQCSLDDSTALDSRKALRGDLESRAVEQSEEFLQMYKNVSNATLETLNALNEAISMCDAKIDELSKVEITSSGFQSKYSALRAKEASLEAELEELSAFVDRYELNEAQTSAIVKGPSIGEEFFQAAQTVERIAKEADSRPEIFEKAESYKKKIFDSAFEYACEERSDWDGVFRCLKILPRNLAYSNRATELVVSARAEILAETFRHELMQSSRPIEAWAHDPVRYVGEMLAFLHSGSLMERANFDVENFNVSRLFSASLKDLFERRAAQALANADDAVSTFKLSKTFSYYSNVLGNDALGLEKLSEAAFKKTLKILSSLSLRSPALAYARPKSAVCEEVSNFVSQVMLPILEAQRCSLTETTSEARAAAFSETSVKLAEVVVSHSRTAKTALNDLSYVHSAAAPFDFTSSLVETVNLALDAAVSFKASELAKSGESSDAYFENELGEISNTKIKMRVKAEALGA